MNTTNVAKSLDLHDFSQKLSRCNSQNLTPIGIKLKSSSVTKDDAEAVFAIFEKCLRSDKRSTDVKRDSVDSIAASLKAIFVVTTKDMQFLAIHTKMRNIAKLHLETAPEAADKKSNEIAKAKIGQQIVQPIWDCVFLSQQYHNIMENNKMHYDMTENGFFRANCAFLEIEEETNEDYLSALLLYDKISNFIDFYKLKKGRLEQCESVKELTIQFIKIIKNIRYLLAKLKVKENLSEYDKYLASFVRFVISFEFAQFLFPIALSQALRADVSSVRSSVPFNDLKNQLFNEILSASKQDGQDVTANLVKTHCIILKVFENYLNHTDLHKNKRSDLDVQQVLENSIDEVVKFIRNETPAFETVEIYKPSVNMRPPAKPKTTHKHVETKEDASHAQLASKDASIMLAQNLDQALAIESQSDPVRLYRNVDERVLRWFELPSDREQRIQQVKTFKKEYESMTDAQIDGLIQRHAFASELDNYLHLLSRKKIGNSVSGKADLYTAVGKWTMNGSTKLVQIEYIVNSDKTLVHHYIQILGGREELLAAASGQLKDIEFPPLAATNLSLSSAKKPLIFKKNKNVKIEIDESLGCLKMFDKGNGVSLELNLPQLD